LISVHAEDFVGQDFHRLDPIGYGQVPVTNGMMPSPTFLNRADGNHCLPLLQLKFRTMPSSG
jgi:hypothetical protein